MATYSGDRSFTDYIHDKLAIPLIYNPLRWEQVSLDQPYAKHIDMQQGIDYVFKDTNGNLKTVQERFRESKYKKYNDFTIRYRRDGNAHSDRHESEYYKMKADFFTYGITNCDKTSTDMCSNFIKYAIVDMKRVYEKIETGRILISDNKEDFCTHDEANGRIICPVKYNRDGSSSFFPIDIALLVKLWGREILIAQNGYL